MTPPPPPPPGSAAPVQEAVPLARLAAGEAGVVVRVDAPATEVERLAALGVATGVEVRILRSGRTLTVAVGEARFGLGRAWARAVTVVRC
jgi:Fe2+ transport system protein FeoA